MTNEQLDRMAKEINSKYANTTALAINQVKVIIEPINKNNIYVPLFNEPVYFKVNTHTYNEDELKADHPFSLSTQTSRKMKIIFPKPGQKYQDSDHHIEEIDWQTWSTRFALNIQRNTIKSVLTNVWFSFTEPDVTFLNITHTERTLRVPLWSVAVKITMQLSSMEGIVQPLSNAVNATVALKPSSYEQTVEQCQVNSDDVQETKACCDNLIRPVEIWTDKCLITGIERVDLPRSVLSGQTKKTIQSNTIERLNRQVDKYLTLTLFLMRSRKLSIIAGWRNDKNMLSTSTALSQFSLFINH